MNDHIAPEERLLKLIRKGDPPKLDADKKEPDKKVSARSIPSGSGVSARSRRVPSFGFRKLLLWGFFLAVLYFGFSIVSPFFDFNKLFFPKGVGFKRNISEVTPSAEVKPFAFYREGVSGRQIFSPLASKEVVRPIGGSSLDLFANIGLMGIILDETPQAIIEDKKSHKIYYVHEGEMVGDFRIEEIQEGKIILNYQTERFELYL